MFGLVYYVKPGWDETSSEVYPASAGSCDYDFQVLSLKALFRDSAVSRFESAACLSVNSLFGFNSRKDDGGAILLKGQYQERDGVASYQLRCEKPERLKLSGGIINRVELSSVEMLTVNAEKNSYAFMLRGLIDFNIWINKETPTDIFSFGTDNTEGAVKGLAFSHLEIAGEGNEPLYLKTGGMNFDLSNSYQREGSLFACFKLRLTEMVEDDGTVTPPGLGYVPLLTGMGEIKGKWYGLKAAVNFGTLGELAEKISLDSEILLAWAAGGSSLFIGLKPPGADGSFGLQNVLKITYGPIALINDNGQFFLMMTNIALKIFGVVKLPPSGNTIFYLFGPGAGTEGAGLGWFAMYKS